MVSDMIWPLVQLMMVIDIPLLEIERQDLLLMTFWIFAEFTLMTSYIFHAGITWQKMNRQTQHRRGVLIAAGSVLLLSLPSIDIRKLLEWNGNSSIWAGILFLIVLPVILYKEKEDTGA